MAKSQHYTLIKQAGQRYQRAQQVFESASKELIDLAQQAVEKGYYTESEINAIVAYFGMSAVYYPSTLTTPPDSNNVVSLVTRPEGADLPPGDAQFNESVVGHMEIDETAAGGRQAAAEDTRGIL